MLLWMLTGVIIVLLILSLVAGCYFYNLALNPRFSKTVLFGPPSPPDPQKEEKKRWFQKTCSKHVSIRSFDGLSLAGYIAESTSNSSLWAIIVHGYTANASCMYDFAKGFYSMGFNLLLPDARGHGRSQGSYIGMGWHERHDIKSWIEYINKNYLQTEIILFGVSMGAATVMMVSGENLPPNVKCIIEDCGYTSIREEFHYQLKNSFHLPDFPILPAASLITRIKAGYSLLFNGSAIKQVARSHTPTLFIHGTEDKFVPFFMLSKLYLAASCPKEKLVIDGAAHAKACEVKPELYWETIKDFTGRYINTGSRP